jgi:hypothetical protein
MCLIRRRIDAPLAVANWFATPFHIIGAVTILDESRHSLAFGAAQKLWSFWLAISRLEVANIPQRFFAPLDIADKLVTPLLGKLNLSLDPRLALQLLSLIVVTC